MTTKQEILTTLQKHKAALARLGVAHIGLFGSYSRDTQTKESDIDLFIDFHPDQENFDNYMAICDFFEHVFRNNRVEIVTKNGLSKHIGPKILNSVVYV